MPSTVLAEHQLAFRHADRFRIDDLIGRFLLEISVLMDAGLVRESVAPDNGLVRLRSEGDGGAQHLACAIEMLGLDAGREGITVVAGLDRHDDLLERAVSGALADAVDGALDLPRPGLNRGDRVGYRESQIVVAMHADHGRVAESL